MAKLKPWYHVVTPREDLRHNRPLDASEFAVHLEHVRNCEARDVYRKPEQFFERTYLTGSLLELAAQTVRRLSGVTVETSAVFNMSTQFGGGKTHALTTLFHLGRGGEKAEAWKGVDLILRQAQVQKVPRASVAAFVGTEFDLLDGRGGAGEPTRRTLWGELAWQLGGQKSFAAVARHDESGTVPGGDVVRQMLPEGPVLILLDEMISYVSRGRKKGLAEDFFNFMQVLTETVRARNDAVLCVSIPASVETEMTPADEQDFQKLKKLLERLGKAIMMSEKTEFAEIIRRRLFEWNGLPEEGRRTASAYAEWVRDNGAHLAGFEGSQNEVYEKFQAMYPFHPSLLSVFERKWQTLQGFQRTRGVLRLLALWVSRAYQEEHRRAMSEPLISLGSAPLEDQVFRSAVFGQLGENPVAQVTTDIAGKSDSHAVRLDEQAREHMRKLRLHQKVATVIFFESNGGHIKSKAQATVSEIKAAVAAPDCNPMDVDEVLEDLMRVCFYLSCERNRYEFSINPNLNQMLVARRGDVRPAQMKERIEKEIGDLFKAGAKDVDRQLFPERSADVADRPKLTLVVLSGETPKGEAGTAALMESIVRDCGTSGRTFKSALIFVVPEAVGAVRDAAQTLLAWEEIKGDREAVDGLTKSQEEELERSHDRTAREFKEALARSYRHLYLLGKDNKLKHLDVDGQARGSFVEQVLARLEKSEEVTEKFAAHKLIPLWPAFVEWSTRSALDAFYSSPLLPRLRREDVLQRTIADGVGRGLLGYARKDGQGQLQLERFNETMSELQVEISDEVYLVKGEVAKQLRARAEQKAAGVEVEEPAPAGGLGSGSDDAGVRKQAHQQGLGFEEKPPVPVGPKRVTVEAEVPFTEFHTFYTGVLNKLGRTADKIQIQLKVVAESERGFSPTLIDDEVRETLHKLFHNDKALRTED